MIERSVWIDDAPGREEYDVQKIATNAIKTSGVSDLIITTTTKASYVSSLPP